MSDPQTRKLSHYFTHSKRKGRPGLPLASVTMNDGLVLRDDMDRKMDTSLSDEEHSLVEPGDIAYNMMRMWQGAFGLASAPVNVSPAYVVMRAKPTLDPRFAAHWLKSDRALYLLWAYSYGLTDDRLRLYPKEFLQIPVQWPDLAEQQRIAAALDAWDEAIATADKLCSSLSVRHRALIAQLSSLPDTPKFELDTFAQRASAQTPVSPQTPWSIELENVEAGTGRLLSRTPTQSLNGMRIRFQATDTLFGKLRPYLRKFYFAEADGVASTEFWVFRADKKRCRPKFLYFLLQSNAFAAQANKPTGSRMPRADWSIVSSTPLPLPTIPKQDALLEALETGEMGLQSQRNLVALLRDQKRALMQKLLTGQLPVPESIDALLLETRKLAS